MRRQPVTPPTTTTQFAGKAPSSPSPADLTVPESGVILSGTAINPSTGRPFRHLWAGDELHGLCRLDPDVDTPGIHAINSNSCVGFVNAVAFKPGQVAFDPATNNIYTTDIQAGSLGVFRLHFQPSGDSGQGSIDPVNIDVLVGSGYRYETGPRRLPDAAKSF